MNPKSRITTLITAIILSSALTGCVANLASGESTLSRPDPSALGGTSSSVDIENDRGGEPQELPTDACAEAFREADEGERELYATHPLYGEKYYAIYEDGIVSEDEQEWLDWATADEVEAYNAILDPVYDACSGVEDLYAGAYALGEDSYWALVGFDEESSKESFIGFLCLDQQSRPACSDYVSPYAD